MNSWSFWKIRSPWILLNFNLSIWLIQQLNSLVSFFLRWKPNSVQSVGPNSVAVPISSYTRSMGFGSGDCVHLPSCGAPVWFCSSNVLGNDVAVGRSLDHPSVFLCSWSFSVHSDSNIESCLLQFSVSWWFIRGGRDILFQHWGFASHYLNLVSFNFQCFIGFSWCRKKLQANEFLHPWQFTVFY